MIGVIHIVLTKGELINQDQLRSIASELYPNQIDEFQHRINPGLQGYLDNIESTYVCAPRNAVNAIFIWLDAQEFEIVIETAVQAHMFRSIEGIIRRLKQRCKQLGLKLDIDIDLRSTSDSHVYIFGKNEAFIAFFWGELRENVVAIIIAVAAIFLSLQWFNDYIQEAVVSLITLILFTFWQIYKVIREYNKKPVIWRIND